MCRHMTYLKQGCVPAAGAPRLYACRCTYMCRHTAWPQARLCACMCRCTYMCRHTAWPQARLCEARLCACTQPGLESLLWCRAVLWACFGDRTGWEEGLLPACCQPSCHSDLLTICNCCHRWTTTCLRERGQLHSAVGHRLWRMRPGAEGTQQRCQQCGFLARFACPLLLGFFVST